MEFCTQDHFAFNDQLSQQFIDLDMGEWLCPPLNYQMKLKGRVSSSVSKKLEIAVIRCDDVTNSNCVGDANVTQL